MTASSISWTPLFLNAEPQMTGTNLKLQQPLRSAATICFSPTSSPLPSRNFAMISSSTSAQASIIFSRNSWALGLEVLGDLDPLVLLALRRLVEDRGLHLDEVDDALVLVLFADGILDRDRRDAEALLDRVHVHLEVGADLVHLVDEHDARDAELVGLTPDGLRLRLDAVAAVEHGDGAVEHARASARPRW